MAIPRELVNYLWAYFEAFGNLVDGKQYVDGQIVIEWVLWDHWDTFRNLRGGPNPGQSLVAATWIQLGY
jgi:hypothetical protein